MWQKILRRLCATARLRCPYCGATPSAFGGYQAIVAQTKRIPYKCFRPALLALWQGSSGSGREDARSGDRHHRRQLQLISDYRSLYRGRRRWARPRRRARPRRCSGSSAWAWSWRRTRSGLRSRSGSWCRSCCCCCCCCWCRRRRVSRCWSRRGRECSRSCRRWCWSRCRCSSRQLKSIDFVISSNVDTPTSHNANSAVGVCARHQFVRAATGIHNRASISVVPM